MLGESFIGPSGHDKERSGREPVAGGRNGNRDRSVKGDQCPSEFVPISELPAVMEGTGDHPANLLDPHALRQRGEWIRITIFTINIWWLIFVLYPRSIRRAARFKARGNGFRHRARPCLKTSTWSATGGCSSKWREPRNWAESREPLNRIASLNWTSLLKRIKRPWRRILETRRGTKHSYCEILT